MLQEAYRCFVSLLQKWGLQRLYATDLMPIKVRRLLLPQPPLLDLVQLLTIRLSCNVCEKSGVLMCSMLRVLHAATWQYSALV